MRVTMADMRQAVTAWLRTEQADKEQAAQLLDAVYGGIIDGDTYYGVRHESLSAPFRAYHIRRPVHLGEAPADHGIGEYEDPSLACGCLVDTLERITGGDRPADRMSRNTTVAFAIAQKIPFGGTPDNNGWSRAAARGIEDYFVERGW